MRSDVPPPVRGTQRGKRVQQKQNPVGQVKALLGGLGIEIDRESLGDLMIAAGNAINQYRALKQARKRRTRIEEEEDEDDEEGDEGPG